jgi:hypothetical protein
LGLVVDHILEHRCHHRVGDIEKEDFRTGHLVGVDEGGIRDEL